MGQTQEFDCVILLANLMDADGTLNEECAARADSAAQAYKAGRAPVIVACGWAYREDSDLTVAEAMRRYLTDRHRIPPAAILLEEGSRDTVGDAYFSKRNLAGPRGWGRLSVATSAYHAERSREIFQFIYGADFSVEMIPAPSENTPALREAETRSLDAFRGTFDGVRRGDDAAILDRLRSRHPFYNGQVYPGI